MAEGTAELAALVRRLQGVAEGESMRRIQNHVGARSKGAVNDAATATLGADKAMSNFRKGRVRLGVGYDRTARGLVLNLRPRGLWVLAESGRRHAGVIRPKRGHRALMTPQGPRRSSRYGPSRGKRSITVAERNVQRVAGPATDEAIARELAKVVRG